MPQGNHPNWLAFVAMAADPADIAGNEKPAEGGIEVGNFTSILTPDPEDKSASTLNEFCAFLKLHALCFSGIYERIDEIISEEFDTIFDSATRQTAITKEDAAHQYANHITVIDQILVHLGGAVPVEGCLIKKTGKKGTKKLVESVASVKSVA